MSNQTTRSTVAVAAHALRAVSLPDVFDDQDLAGRLGINPAIVRRAIREDGLPGRRIGRRWVISRAALLAWLASPARNEPERPHLHRVDGEGES